MQYNDNTILQCNTIRYNTIRYNKIQYNTIQYKYNTIQYITLHTYIYILFMCVHVYVDPHLSHLYLARGHNCFPGSPSLSWRPHGYPISLWLVIRTKWCPIVR